MDYRSIISVSLDIFLIALFSIFARKRKKRIISTRFIAGTAIFASIAIILYIVPIFNLPLPIFPSFLKFHFDEIPALIAGFAYGPISGIIVILIKTISKLPMTITGGVGELADLLYSLSFVVPASLIYKKIHSFKGAIISLLVAMVVQVVFSSIFTSFVILDFYMNVMGWSEKMLLSAIQAANPNITSLGWTVCWLVMAPFNLLKDIIVILITIVVYKRLHNYIDKKIPD